ncbi:hypothetical protein SAMN03080594_10155 [Arenibacter palladensis]|uniref:Uncharacterized protein n=1 Tax=Arenibacter palladensis TaxID=237373 RepID=A0A1M4SWN5_9FLAO|nr:hypothetical protein SAMN03080594_10155 [Arenibacter palladensis]
MLIFIQKRLSPMKRSCYQISNLQPLFKHQYFLLSLLIGEIYYYMMGNINRSMFNIFNIWINFLNLKLVYYLFWKS